MKRAQSCDLHPEPTTRVSDGPDLLRQIDVCAKLGISDQTWMRWRRAGKTPAAVVMPSGRAKWRRVDIDAMAAAPVERGGRRRYFASVYRKPSARECVAVHDGSVRPTSTVHQSGIRTARS